MEENWQETLKDGIRELGDWADAENKKWKRKQVAKLAFIMSGMFTTGYLVRMYQEM